MYQISINVFWFYLLPFAVRGFDVVEKRERERFEYETGFFPPVSCHSDICTLSWGGGRGVGGGGGNLKLLNRNNFVPGFPAQTTTGGQINTLHLMIKNTPKSNLLLNGATLIFAFMFFKGHVVIIGQFGQKLAWRTILGGFFPPHVVDPSLIDTERTDVFPATRKPTATEQLRAAGPGMRKMLS